MTFFDEFVTNELDKIYNSDAFKNKMNEYNKLLLGYPSDEELHSIPLYYHGTLYGWYRCKQPDEYINRCKYLICDTEMSSYDKYDFEYNDRLINKVDLGENKDFYDPIMSSSVRLSPDLVAPGYLFEPDDLIRLAHSNYVRDKKKGGKYKALADSRLNTILSIIKKLNN